MGNYKVILITSLVIFLFVIAILFLFVVDEEKESYCGDHVCEDGENYENCPEDCKSTQIEKGINGYVTLYQGNCMPPAGIECLINKLSTTVKIYDLISKEDVIEGYYVGEKEPIATVISNQEGYYEIGLPNGQYSILVEDPINENKDYCNSFDNEYACPVLVNDELVEFNIRIDYASW